jgi:3'(2'), 5'-bisphosphate nucleotidase
MFQDYRSEAETALRVVTLAAELVRKIQSEAGAQSMQKVDLSPVTVADYASQAVISCLLEEAFPDDVLVAEEGSTALSSPEGEDTLGTVMAYVRRFLPAADEHKVCAWIDRGAGKPGQRYWLLDPVDGTKGFIRGDQYVVALGLIDDGQVVLGALGCPNLGHNLRPDVGGEGSAVIAVKDQGAWVASMEGKILDRLRVSDENEPYKARLLRSVESQHTDEGKMAQLMAALGIRSRPMNMDSQAKYAMLAAGEADLIFRLNSPLEPDRKEYIWDQAPGYIVVREAGGCVTDLRGADLDFTAGRRLDRNFGVLVSNAHLHEAALQAVQGIGAHIPPEAE